MTPRRAAHGLSAVVTAILLLTTGGAAQTPRDVTGRASETPPGSASISGVVIAADSGRPLRRARLTLNGLLPGAGNGASSTRSVVSDDQGRFTFEALTAGQFTLDASHDQFLSTSYGQRKAGRPGTPIDLGATQRLRLTVPMTRGGVITGSVVDDLGEPLMNARVRAMRFVLVNGFRRLRSASEVRTDDRGIYRIFGLEPGEYLVSGAMPLSAYGYQTISMEDVIVRSSTGDDFVPALEGLQSDFLISVPGRVNLAPTFYPGVTTAGSALRIAVEGGTERSGVDIRILPIRTGTIEGIVSGAPGANVPVQVLLQNTDASAEQTAQSTTASPTGQFTLPGVLPGSYIVYAQTLPSPQAMPPNGGEAMVAFGDVRRTSFVRMHGRTPVTVDGEDPATIVITLAPGRQIAGHVTFALPQRTGRGPATTISIVPLPQNPQLPAFNTSPQVDVDADGNFTLPGIRPGRYVLRASGPGTLKSVLLNGLDTLDSGLEVTEDTDVSGVELTLTDRVSTLSGTIVNGDGRPATDNTIVVAPTNANLWRNGSRRILTTRPATDGRYAMRGLPPGEYYLAAVTDIEAGEQFDPEFLRALVGAAVTVTIMDGANTTQNLKVAQ
ncbi:MAG: carboxypeptidase regulatory-like domain-containing protein [Acidobacteriota bacterium]